MWLIVAAIAALVTTYAWLNNPLKTKRYGQLSMAFWALTIMIFIDHVIGWFVDGAEGPFLEVGADEVLLSLCMIIPIFAIWEMLLVFDRIGLKNAMKNINKSEDKTENKEVD